eukprot:TRINITY_DN500_c1_g2_i3.p1 TRINITY_DN500_c1_g2~~TRINITY_DN500_c1_g2_i3.p1  ORF type:complete len:634 (-),score=292.28 TRINITY_DN500_c1_g2_i3:255-2156(-)
MTQANHSGSNTLVRWVNSHLMKKQLKIEKFPEDLENGVLLVQLYECITGKPAKKYSQNPKTEFQKLENVQVAMDLFKEDGVKVDTASDVVVKGNTKLILGLIWSLICRYQSIASSASTLEFLRDEAKFSGQKVEVTGKLKTDLQSGFLLAVLINNRYPDAIKLEDLSETDHVANLQMVMDFAEKEMKIPKLVLPEEIASGTLEDQALITYLSYFPKKDEPKTPRSTPRGPPPVDDQITKLQSEIQALKSELATHRSNEEAMAKDRDAASEKLATCEQQSSDFKIQLENFKNQLESSQVQLENSQKDHDASKSELQVALDKLRKSEENSTRTKSQLEKENLQLENSRKEAEQEWEIERQDYEREISELREKLDAAMLESAGEEGGPNMDALIQNMEAQMEAQKQKVLELEQSKMKLQQELEETRQLFEKEQQRLSDLATQKEKFQVEIENLQSRLVEEKSESSELKEMLFKLKVQVEQSSKEEEEIMTRRDARESNLKEVQKKLKEVLKEKEKAEKAARDAEERVAKAKKAKEEEVRKMKQKLQDENKGKVEKDEEIKKLKSELVRSPFQLENQVERIFNLKIVLKNQVENFRTCSRSDLLKRTMKNEKFRKSMKNWLRVKMLKRKNLEPKSGN